MRSNELNIKLHIFLYPSKNTSLLQSLIEYSLTCNDVENAIFQSCKNATLFFKGVVFFALYVHRVFLFILYKYALF